MHNVIRAGELEPSPGGTVTFEGDVGTGRLDVVCISPRMIQEALE
jgi:hypothetical protein